MSSNSIQRAQVRTANVARTTAAMAPTTHFECDDSLLLNPKTKPSSRLSLPQALAKPVSKVRKVISDAATAAAPAVPYLVAAGTVAYLVGKAGAYPCTGYDKDSTQYFTNTNNTLFGFVHGWFSDCYDETYPCGQSCSNNVCSTVYCDEILTDKTPSDYVSAVAKSVQQCGFNLVSGIGPNATTRIANALLEKDRLVKIVVNALNLTDVTDPSIVCLHGIQ